MSQATVTQLREALCQESDLVANSGVCALWRGQQIALFFLPNESPQIYAISNWDPKGKANVLSRGIVGDIDGTLVVASPLYKQHYDLTSGACLEDETLSVPAYRVSIIDGQVFIAP